MARNPAYRSMHQGAKKTRIHATGAVGLLAIVSLLEAGGCSSSDARAAPEGEAARPVARAAPVQAPTTPPAAATPEPNGAHQVATGEPTASSGQQVTRTDNVPNTDASKPSVAEVLALPGSHSTSIGGPSSGRVQGAVPLPDLGPGFYHNAKRPYEARFGTVELVQLIVRAAAKVHADIPNSLLTVNDLGLEHGGPIEHHGSHQAGRDADILFYSVDAQGQPIRSVGVPIDPSGAGVDFKDLADPSDDQPVKLDARRTWRFMAALIDVAGDSLQRIFIVEHVRKLLLEEAARSHAPESVVRRFADLTCQPNSPHDDHMHIRLFCTPEDMAQGCLDTPPTYPFRSQALAAIGLSPQLASMKRSAAERRAHAARVTTPEQARERAGPMHKDVTQFLKQREAWLKKPSPGRPYCN